MFASALVRRCFVEGAFAVVGRHGADEAGAIFVTVDRLDGSSDLYAPAPQSAFDGSPTDRLFQLIVSRAAPQDIAARLAREVRYDPDLWVIGIEDRDGRSFLDLARAG